MHERSGWSLECNTSHSRFSQVSNYGGAKRKEQCGASSICDPTSFDRGVNDPFLTVIELTPQIRNNSLKLGGLLPPNQQKNSPRDSVRLSDYMVYRSFSSRPSVAERNTDAKPSSPISGSRLPVFGSSVGSAAGAGAGLASAIKIGASAGGGGGGGGIDPVNCFSCSTTVTGSSTTLVAETVIPFFSPHASVSWPLT